ncbi:hypothetical protein HG536_0B04930 [Torulaspora globosa]|uniref:CDP-diacylglycerol--glycerol-3-phosphate 3-phosphatidyltransferase n=1 Tax=Torulaspora globosa TaxID=48254 RepID=A0A7G3ZDP3_9SACH|nr:uncharacterized protein HG536_0B04930 [Torulaspora globosa]QLL31629.1 hypothetical protein HG536_0B04930 [Torulaspora globosa]
MLILHPRNFAPLRPIQLLRVRGRIVASRLSYRGSVRGTSNNAEEKALNTSVFTVPNVLTMTRIACTPFIGHYIWTNNLTPALGLFAYSCLTDFLDGHIARKYKLKSVAGTILDPIADKLLMIVTTISLAVPPGPQLIPLPIAGLILGRDVLLGLSALYFRYASMRQKYRKISWASYWDFFHYPSAEVKPTLISKYNTLFQMVYLGLGVLVLILKNREEEEERGNEAVSSKSLAECFEWMGYLVAITTIFSGGSYVFSRDAVKFLKK